MCAYDMKRRLTALWDQEFKDTMMKVFMFKNSCWVKLGLGGVKLFSTCYFLLFPVSKKQSYGHGTVELVAHESVCLP